jgi:hypothetical protein
MNLPFLVAGASALAGAAIHGAAGERLVLRKLFSGPLPSTPFGGHAATKAMIRATWHIVTLTFLVFGSALEACGSLGAGDACRGIGVVAASSFTAYLALAVALALQPPRKLLFHPGPVLFLTVAALTWWGIA